MSSKVIFNVGLLIETNFSNKLIEYSQKIKKIHPCVYSLGEDSLPHVTLLHFEEKEDKAEIIWNRVQHLFHQSLELDFRHLSIGIFGPLNFIWVLVARKQNLEGLQKEVVDSLAPLNLNFFTGIGDNYEPHATLAAWPCLDEAPSIPILSSVLNTKKVRAHLSLGISGPNYQFAKKIFPI